MTTYKDWITSNIETRLEDKLCDFNVSLKPTPFKTMKFKEAATMTAQLIYEQNKKVYVALSGGIDSEFVFYTFHKAKIPFTPIIIDKPDNIETRYAFHVCRKEKIEPVIVPCSNETYQLIFGSMIQKLNTNGIHSVLQVLAHRYAIMNDGICVIGDHMIDDDDTKVDNVSITEWEWTIKGMFPKEPYAIFFDYTPELFYSMVSSFNGDLPSEFKHELYDRPYRPKMRFPLPELPTRIGNPRYKHRIGSKKEVIAMMKKWNKQTKNLQTTD